MSRLKNDGKGRMGGRQKGTPNKRTQQLIDRCYALNCDPFEILVHIAKGDWASLGYVTGVINRFGKDGALVEIDRIPFGSRMEAAKELMQYLYPKRKALDISNDDGSLQANSLESKVTQVKSILKAASERKDGGNESRSS